jgi:hypothetical protein
LEYRASASRSNPPAFCACSGHYPENGQRSTRTLLLAHVVKASAGGRILLWSDRSLIAVSRSGSPALTIVVRHIVWGDEAKPLVFIL